MTPCMSTALPTLLALPLSAVFTTLAALHLYWGVGGQWGGADAVPQRADGTPLFRPGFVACLLIATGLAGFATVALARIGWVTWPWSHPAASPRWLLRVVAALFALRTLGDFRYVGLTRRVRHTRFARQDRARYTPLCAALAAASAALSFA